MNNNLTLKYIGYARKSSEDNKERQAASLPEQIHVLKNIKEKQKLNFIEILQESKSAHKIGREIFNSMLDRIEGGEANAILTWHLNRVSRNMVDGGRIIYLMDTGKLIEIKTPSRAFHNTPEDKFMLSLEFGMSKKDSDDKSIAVKRGLDKKLRDGWRPGVAPQGYLNDRQTDSGFRKILVDPDRFPFIQKIFEMFYDGVPVVDIHRIADEEWKFRTRKKRRSGGVPLSISMIYAMLKNPFYCGKFEYPLGSGEWYDGSHKPAVKQAIYDSIQVKLGRKSPYKTKAEYSYTGMINCKDCGSGVVADPKWQLICPDCKCKYSILGNPARDCPSCGMKRNQMENPTIRNYLYFRCGRKLDLHCKQPNIRVDKLEEQVDELLSRINISPEFMQWAIKQIKKMNDQEKDFREDVVESVKRSHDLCRQKLDNLLQLKISPDNSDGSLLSDDDYKRQKKALEDELKGIEQQLNTTDNRMLQAMDDAVKAFNFAVYAQEKYNDGDTKTKRDIFRGLGLNFWLKDRKVLFDCPAYLNIIQNIKKSAPIVAKRVEPEISPQYRADLESQYAAIPAVLRGKELNLVWEIMLTVKP